MEGGKILVISVLLLETLLVAVLAASAPDPFAGLRVGGKEGLPKGEIDCCDNCKCGGDMTSCICQDSLTGGCADGCKDCHREHGLYRCRDVMDVCPESCDYDYDDEGVWRAGRLRLRAAGSPFHV
ncbi:unnamed protein product [Spirodela intermedia]|uniref:Uncharacterized protein n=1 Tax=Spirodela intermedia TaxID=51605 RepID=A0A7I8K4E0_SPIIN|nr:unnamed protein product [Spirodela intermedia]